MPNFVEKAARAGCVQVFIGMETIRDDNLKAGGKPQNKSAEYREMIARWHAVGVACHVGYIIGFPNDTYERVMEDVRALRETLLVDQASFFMLTPLPGSRDHRVAVRAAVPLDADYNNFDSFHATVPHPGAVSAASARTNRTPARLRRNARRHSSALIFGVPCDASPPAGAAGTSAAGRRAWPEGRRRAAARLNVFSLQRLEARRDHVKEYWQGTWHTALRFELWRLNPFALTWNFVRDCRDAVLFFFAMRSERY